jgi:aminoethylphosphonate catabolism LysR family transcriptional regulator
MYQKWLQAFHTVASEGGFTAAARALNVSQPTISSHVKSLEDHFRVELFLRRGRRIQLTTVGESLLAITQGWYGQEAEAVGFLEAARDFRSGHLNASAVGPYDVMELMEAFHRRHGQLRLSVSLGDARDVRQRVLDFKADVAVLAHEETDPRFHSRFYNRHRVFVIVNAAHPWAGRTAIPMGDLDGQRMVLRTPGSSTRQAFDEARRRAGVGIEVVMEINSREAVREAVIRGLGIGVVSESEFAPHERLRPIPIAGAGFHVPAYVVCLAERRNRPLIKAFFETAEDLIGARAE